MAIRIYENKIEFENDSGAIFTLQELSNGIDFDGKISGVAVLAQQYQGTFAGFASGGVRFSGPPFGGTVNSAQIDRFPFGTDTNAANVGSLSAGRQRAAGVSSSTHGYACGGFNNNPPPTITNTVNKFLFSTTTTGSTVGNLTETKTIASGHSDGGIFGYVSGGFFDPPSVTRNTIERFSFSDDTFASDVGDLSAPRSGHASQSSATHGYVSGGYGPVSLNTILKFPFAVQATSVDIADLTVGKQGATGHSSTVSGYTAGGNTTAIDKFPFATDSNATAVGIVVGPGASFARRSATSSTISGYMTGGVPAQGGPPVINVIDKFSFTTDGDSTDVGDLSVIQGYKAGHQD